MFDAIRLGGVGGIARYSRGAVKCVHLQMASYLGAGNHPAGDWLDRHTGSWECAGGYCSSA
jgi:hypothetical protein